MLNLEVTMRKQITKAKIKMQEKFPFFGRLALSYTFIEDDGKYAIYGPFATMQGNKIFYNPSKMKNLSQDKIMGLIAHEIMHNLLNHFQRIEYRDMRNFNIATDIVVNSILLKNGFTLPEEMFLPVYNTIMVEDKIIKDISEKSAEKIYNEISDLDSTKEYPVHYYFSEPEDMKQDVQDAKVFAKDRGIEPKGFNLIKPVQWDRELRKYFNSTIISGYSFSKPRKLAGILLPGKIKNNIRIVIHIDTSASVSDNLLSMFKYEISRISKLNKNVDITMILCNDEIQSMYNYKKNKTIEFKSGGLTSHKPVVRELNKMNKSDLFISMTDGYSDIGDCYPNIRGNVKKLILLTDKSMEKGLNRYAKIIITE